MRIRMMRGAALVLALVMLLSLCGCGEEDPYSAAMRAGEEQGLFGQGDKVAVYNTKKGSYVRKYLQEEMLAASPEEVGFILSFSEQRNGLVSFVLMDAADGTEISNAGYSRKTLSTEGGRYVSVVSWVSHSLEEYDIQQLSDEAQKRFESEEQLTGSKLVFYDSAEERFDFTSEYIEEELQTGEPEEIGAFLYVSEDGSGGSLLVELRGSEPGRPVVASSSFEKDEGSDPIAWWVGNESKIYFQDRDYALLLETEDPGGGDKIIIFDPESGRYTTRDLDEDILAASPHETALIAQMEEAGWVEGLQGYGFTGVGVPYTYVEFDLQQMKITLLDAETGVPYAETILCAGYPDSVAVGTQHETAWVGQGMINNWLREQLESYLAARG